MDFRQTFQNAGNRAETAAPAPSTHSGDGHSKKPLSSDGASSGNRLQSLLNLVILVCVAVLLLLLAFLFASGGKNNTEGKYVVSGKYQAVFLNNGQVYFGNIRAINENFVDLQNVYYLTQNSTAASNNQTQANGDYTLVKLGCQQIHYPGDQMIIARDQVSFWENLNDDGKVVKSIGEFKKQNPNGPNCSEVSNQTQASSQSTQATGNQTAPTQATTNPANNNASQR